MEEEEVSRNEIDVTEEERKDTENLVIPFGHWARRCLSK
jgi:hypothetical protein